MPERINESLSALLDGEADELEIRRILNSCDKDPSIYHSWQRLQMVRSALRDDPISHVDLSAGIRQALSDMPMDEVPAAVERVNAVTQTDDLASAKTLLVDRPTQPTDTAVTTPLAAVESVGQVVGASRAVMSQPAQLGFATIAKISMVAAAVGLMSAFLVIESNTHMGSTLPKNRLVQNEVNHYLSSSTNTSARFGGTTNPSVELPRNFSQSSSSDVMLDRRLDAYFLQHAEFSSLNTGRGLMPFARMVSGQSTTRR